jgi:hypothetical protein
VFIDELDRCRPTYSIELLERIKHLFDIPGLVFVLATDLAQLSNSICAVYGSRFDSRRYLQRFINLEYSLKEPQKSDYIKALTQSLGISRFTSNKYKSDFLLKTCVLMCDIYNSDLRSINSFLWRLKLSLSTYSEENRSEHAVLLAIFLSLRLYDIEAYERCQANPVARVELLEKIIHLLDFNDHDNGLLLYEIFRCLMGTTFQEDSIERKQNFYSSGSLIENILNKIPLSERDYINECVSSLISGGISEFKIQEVVEKVELFSRIEVSALRTS